MIDPMDAEVIASMVHDAEVLQLGCREGFDTATLARTAHRVVACGQHPGIEHAGFQSAASMWVTVQRFYAVADRSLLLSGKVRQVLDSFTPGQFDVVVIDCGALQGQIDVPMVQLVRAIAGKVIVLPGTYGSWDTWQGTMAPLGFRCEQAGRVWVFDRIPTDAEIESKEGS